MKDPIQEQLALARRHQILDAAAKVFASKGFHPTTIKDIAREAGLADGTIYIYFANKPALLIGIFDRMREAVMQTADMTEMSDGNVRSFIRAYLKHPLMALKGDNFELFRIVASEMMVNQDLRDAYYATLIEPMLTMAEKDFQRWVDQGKIKPVNVRLMLRVLSGTVFGLIMERVMGDKVLQDLWDDLPDVLTELILNGLMENEK